MKTILAIGLLVAAGAAAASAMYEVDENRDGRTDRVLILEQSDALA